MFNLSDQEQIDYDKNKVNVLIIRIRKCSDENKLQRYKMELFLMMKKIIVKNIHNYLKLSNNSEVKEDSLNFFEIQSEAYLVLDKCIQNYDVNPKNDFYFYLNKSLSRNFYRMFNQSKVQKTRNDMVSDFIKFFGNHQKNGVDEDIEFLIDQLGFNTLQKRILISKIYNISKSKFLAQNKDITSDSYNSIHEQIKIILNKIQQEK